MRQWQVLPALGLLCGLELAAGLPARLDKLPDWAQHAAQEVLGVDPPAGTDAWVLLVQREVRYAGAGKYKVRSRRVVHILRGRGFDEATFVRRGLLEGRVSLKDLRGWNLRPDGELVKLHEKDRFTVADNTGATFDTTTAAIAILPRIAEGSVVAFESLEEFEAVRNPLRIPLLEVHPVRRWELTCPEGTGRGGTMGQPILVEPESPQPWFAPRQVGPGRMLSLTNLRPLPAGETALPRGRDILPFVEIQSQDPAWPPSMALQSWDRLASWYFGIFSPQVLPVLGTTPDLPPGLPGLQTLWHWFGKNLTYKQVYLSPERDNLPEAAPEVARKRYGDCKDLTCLFIAMARQAGFEGFPVLARLQQGPLLEVDLERPRDRFDHVLVALRLDKTLGLPAEVPSKRGRFLLLDPTDPFTPLGRLGEAHRGGRLLICLQEGGQWVQVPPDSILDGRVDLQFDGAQDPTGSFRGSLVIRESGGLWGLRSRAHVLNRAAFRSYLESQILDLPLNSSWDIADMGDPLDLDSPFLTTLRLVYPTCFTREGSEWMFHPPVGVPGLLPPLTQNGRNRFFPVEFLGSSPVTLHGRIQLPRLVRPIKPEFTGTSPIRSLAWSLTTEPNQGGCVLCFEIQHQSIPAYFPTTLLGQAAEAWKRDRSILRLLREEGLALRPL